MSKICPVCGTTYADASAFCPTDGTTLRAADVTADLIGSVIADRYLVTDLLGEGGMGKVYLARHVRLPKQAAIKVLRSAMLTDTASVARFQEEAANASLIEHDRVARVFDFGETPDGTMYLAMEYVPGRTLKKVLAVTGALEPRRAAALVRQIAQALDAAHRLGIVHRDLKPDNVMLVEDPDGSERVKVVDFGIAKALNGDGRRAGLTQAGYVVGTLEFMSPEQLLGGQLDARSDVYALAIVAYQCLTGTFPFDTSTPERVMAARLTEAPRALSHAQPAVAWPAPVQAVLDAGLARDVEQRTPSAGAFARALAEAIEQWLPAGPGVHRLVTPSDSSILTPGPEAPGGTATPPVMSTAPREPEALGHRTAEVGRSDRRTAGPRWRMPLIVGGGGALTALAVAAVLFARDRAAAGGSATAAPAVVVQPATDGGSGGPPVDTDTPPVGGAVNGQSTVSSAGGGTNNTSIDPPLPARTGGTRGGAQGASEELGARSPKPPVVTVDDGSAAALGQLAKELQASPDVDDARRIASQLQALLPRLRVRQDSTWAYIRLAYAHMFGEDDQAACRALEAARRGASGRDQTAELARLGQLAQGC